MKNINKKALLIWIRIAALLGIAIYFYIVRTQQKPDPQDTNPPPQGWTEVSIEEDGITFSFPPDWQLSECPTGIECPENDTSIYLEIPFTFTQGNGQESVYYLQLLNIPNEDRKSLEEIKNEYSGVTESYKRYLTDDNRQFFRVSLVPFSENTPYPKQNEMKEKADKIADTVTFTP